MLHELLLVEIRKDGGIIADDGKDLKIISVADLGQALRDVDGIDIVGDESRYIGTHPRILETRNDTGNQKDGRYCAHAEGQFGPQ